MESAPSLTEGEGVLDSQLVFSQTLNPASGVLFQYRTGMSANVGFGISTVHYLVAGEVLQVHFPGSNVVTPVGIDPLASVTSYFIGSDPSLWRPGLVDFGAIIYEDLYPGIDLKYKIANHALKYEFIVWPGADPSAIQMEFTNADSLMVQLGEVRATIGAGCFVDTDLVTYQEDDKDIIPVKSSFYQQGPRSVSFYVSDYDESKALVIDPIPNVLRYGSYLGAGGNDYCRAIAVEDGYAYVTGYTNSDPFNTTSAFDASFNGGSYDAFVTKMNLGASALVYSTYLGNAGDDRGLDIDVESGYAYVTGQSSGTGTTIWGTTGYDRSHNGGVYEAFVTKMGLTGTTVVYATYLGGSGDDYGESIAVENGYAYVAGQTGSPSFNTTGSAFDPSPNGNIDAFVTKLHTAGTSLIYSTILGGASTDYAYGIAVEAGYAFVAGTTASNPFNTTADAFDTTFNGASYFDGFVTKFNAAGSALVYSTYLGGTDFDYIRDIAVEDGNAYIVGDTESTDLPATSGAFDGVYNGGSTGGDAFAAKLSHDGASLAFCTYLGGTVDDTGRAIAVHAGSAYVTGYTTSSTFPITVGALDSTYGLTEAFVSKLSADGSRLDYSTFIGGSDTDFSYGIAAENMVVYVCGSTYSTNFPTSAGAFDRVRGGFSYDGFVIKLGEDADSDTIPDDWETAYGLSTSASNYDLDSDNDGIGDRFEFAMGTNPVDDDTENDGMPDGWEDNYGFDPLVNDAAGDADTDGLTNGQEYIYGTFPDDGDSDNDGLSDGAEVITYHTDPLANADADSDGISDAVEITVHNSDPHKVDSDNDNLSDSYEAALGTSLIQADTDGDGFDDGVEVARGTDPKSEYSYPGSSNESPLALDTHDYVIIGLAGAIGLIALIIALALHASDKKAIKRLEDKLGGNKQVLPADRAAKAEPSSPKKKEEPPAPKKKAEPVADAKQKGKK